MRIGEGLLMLGLVPKFELHSARLLPLKILEYPRFEVRLLSTFLNSQISRKGSPQPNW